MKKSILTLFALVAIATSHLMAGNVDQQRAQRIGERFLTTTVLGQQRSEIQLDLVQVAAQRGEADYYVFNNRGNNGFVIVSGDDRVKPILAYATSGSFDPENVAEGFAFMLNSFSNEIQYVRDHNLTATPDIMAEWSMVQKTGSLQQGRQARAVVGPLCQTTWNQNFPYNSQCPEDEEGNGGYVYAGCVATAMGQVMKYWNYPEHGTGSYSYHPSGYDQQTANFGETHYHFELMPNDLDSLSTEEDYFYIAQFLHHCGIAVDMQYSGHGSGAYSQDVPTALQNYFGYSSIEFETLGFWGWNFYTNEQWAQMLKDGGLDEYIPLYYSGSDDNGAGGHAFVCDGYDENDYFHFNWGWSGRDDAWCPIGALNTTKYAFNDGNSFIGHIVPAMSDYYQRADSVAEFTVTENGDRNGVVLQWTNPSLTLTGEPLNAIGSITIRRNNQPLVVLENVQVGEAGSYEDLGLAPGLYEYSIFVTNTAGVSRVVYRTILVGEKCDVVFMLNDEGGNGWKGAAISVTDENGARIAVVSMSEGAEQTVTVPLLRGNLNFIWNHGWYHTTEEYDTDAECSFSIMDSYGNELYTSGELEDGVFMTLDNNCEEGVLTCYPVQNLQGRYEWHDNDEYGALIAWDKPTFTANLDHFKVIRKAWSSVEDEVIAEIPYDGNSSYEYFDNTYGDALEDIRYSVSSVYVRDEEQCESDLMDVLIQITDVEDQVGTGVKIYPNPTSGMVTVEGQGRLAVMNMLGQTVRELDLNGRTTMELPRGVYFVRINSVTKKVVVE